MKKVIIFILIITTILTGNLFAMDSLSYKLSIKDDNGLEYNKLIFGIHKDATNNIDTLLGEKETPEIVPPSGLYSVFFVTDSASMTKYWSYIDFRPFGEGNFKRVYNIKIMNLTVGYTITWPKLSDLIDSAFVRDVFTGNLVNIDMKENQSVKVENFNQDEFDIIVYYNKDVIDNVKDIRDDIKPMAYPNPVYDFVKIKNVSGFNKYKVVSILGNNIKTGVINNDLIELNLTSIKKGAYYIIIENMTGMKKVLKLIKI